MTGRHTCCWRKVEKAMLVDASPPGFDIDIDIRYATADNFTGAPVYAQAACYLHRDAVPCLERAIRLAAAQGYRLRVYDATRPSEAQWALWSHTPDPEFLADPAMGSPHSRGVAIDLTLIDGTGLALDMGTGFDDFSSQSHHGRTDIPAPAQRNRLLLLGIMISAGWTWYENEWWHYQLPEASTYALLSDADMPAPMMPPGAHNGPE
jgi:D-alanyl-D-alanine dipeptidase